MILQRVHNLINDLYDISNHAFFLVSRESVFVLQTGGRSYTYKLTPEEIYMVKTFGDSKPQRLLDLLNLLVHVFDRYPIENIPLEWSSLFSMQTLGYKCSLREKGYLLSPLPLIERYILSRNTQLHFEGGAVNTEFNRILIEEKSRLGEQYKLEYPRLAEIF